MHINANPNATRIVPPNDSDHGPSGPVLASAVVVDGGRVEVVSEGFGVAVQDVEVVAVGGVDVAAADTERDGAGVPDRVGFGVGDTDGVGLAPTGPATTVTTVVMVNPATVAETTYGADGRAGTPKGTTAAPFASVLGDGES